MIFQINYKTNKYSSYLKMNHAMIKGINLDYKLFDDDEIDYFLKHYKYYNTFYSLKSQEIMFLCDALRVLILYELGGIYIDADTIFLSEIIRMENDLLKIFGDRNIITMQRSMYFIRGVKHSEFMRRLKEIYFRVDELTWDIHMLRMINISDYAGYMAFIEKKRLAKYFIHDKVTTG